MKLKDSRDFQGYFATNLNDSHKSDEAKDSRSFQNYLYNNLWNDEVAGLPLLPILFSLVLDGEKIKNRQS